MKAVLTRGDRLASLPFRMKLTYATLAVTAIALLVSCIGLIGAQYYYDRGNADRQSQQLAAVLASNLGAAVVFHDRTAADTITHSARSVPSVLMIDVRDTAGEQVSLYTSTDLPDADRKAVTAHDQRVSKSFGRFDAVNSYSTPITVNGDRVGSLTIGFRYRSLMSIVSDTLPIALLLFVGCLLVARFMAMRLRRMAFQPLDRLNSSMHEVRVSGNLAERVATSQDPDFNAIITSYNSMLDEIEVRTSELSEAKDMLEVARDQANEANIAKSAFLANMSHELRTPLNAIIGYAEVLQDDLSRAGMDRSVEDLGWIYSSSQQLLELINSLLDLSKIEAGRMEVDVHSFDLRKLLTEVEATLQPLAGKQSNTLVFSTDEAVGMVKSDSTKLRQSLLNLGSNACKFTENGFVHVNTRYDGADIVVEVSDTGIGMSAEEMARLFQPFVQSDSSTTRRFGGTGLGLTLVKRFTEMLGGSVKLASEPGFGSTFTIRIARDMMETPASARAPGEAVDAAPHAPVEGKAQRGRPLALVMEDEPSAVQLLRRLLDRNGYQCMVAGDGESGLEIAQSSEPDLILLDIGLPKIDGWEVLKKFADVEKMRAIPTVVVSVDDRKQISIELGACDHLTKPVKVDELDSILKFYASRRSDHILLVEDDPATSNLYLRGLTQCGYQVTCAQNGAEALALLEDSKFAMIVTDLMMPHSDGYELIDRVASIPIADRPPVVVVTGAVMAPEQRSRIENRVESIQLKSGLTPRALAERISELLDA
ncbi:MAG: response regulator [Proteobacteria bacterium]|nr:response regulator [Pseudomonadota bacterium]